ncbi:MAG TPA: hypothetical protein PKA38_02825 [Candidatus Levybacteria bacterium]|nr:hypothetical protein [Candidatus Levybacteria bacterium]
MTDYGRGSVLGAATSLPATTAGGILLANNADPILVGALFTVSFVSLIVLMGSITRFLINSNRQR